MKNPVSYALAFCLCLTAYCFMIDAPASANLQGAGCSAPAVDFTPMIAQASCSQPAAASCSSPLTPPPENYSAYGSYSYSSSSGSYATQYASHGPVRAIFRRGLFRRGGLFRPMTRWNSHSGFGHRIFNGAGVCLNCG